MSQLTLFIIFIIIYVIQSATLSHAQQANDDTIREKFYCAAKSFADPLKSDTIDKAGLKLTKSAIDDGRGKVLDQIITQFSEVCKDFTKALSLKYQLQDHLFNQIDLSLTTNVVHSILSGLQTIANILDQYQFSQKNKSCVTLSAAEYKMMYHAQFSTALLLNETKTLGEWWVNDEYSIYGEEKPPETCV